MIQSLGHNKGLIPCPVDFGGRVCTSRHSASLFTSLAWHLHGASTTLMDSGVGCKHPYCKQVKGLSHYPIYSNDC